MLCEWLTSQALVPLAVDNSVANAGSSSNRPFNVPPDQTAASNGFTDNASYPSSWPPNSARGKPQPVGPELAKRLLSLQKYVVDIQEQLGGTIIASKSLSCCSECSRQIYQGFRFGCCNVCLLVGTVRTSCPTVTHRLASCMLIFPVLCSLLLGQEISAQQTCTGNLSLMIP